MTDTDPSSGRPAPVSRDLLIRAALLVQRGIVHLPWPVQKAIGKALGGVAYRIARRRRRIARRNLELCFPELDETDRETLLRDHFRSLGIGVMEIGMAWWASDHRLKPMARIEGLEHLQQSRGLRRPALLVAGHFTTMDLTCRLLGLAVEYDGIQRPFGLPGLDRQLSRGRRRAVGRLYSKFDLRAILDALAENRTIWMAVDQAQTGSRPVIAPFFGLPAPTTGSPARLTARSGARVLPVIGYREPDGRYRVRIEAPLEDFPSGDATADAARLNRVIERHARLVPDQYYWIHRRFKTDPSPYQDL
ncbi:MAG: lipid A biosynthesis acyltransferase [Gammaproteobacteria bacterium]